MPVILSAAKNSHFAFALPGNPIENIFSSFSAQKSHVKPLNHLTPYSAITSAWHVSSTPTAIIEREGKKAESPAKSLGFFL
jgi:hypothetical protein